MNYVGLIGRLTKDVEIKATQSGGYITRFGLAVDIKKDAIEFFDIKAFDKTAETLGNYTHKGDKILVEGCLRCEKYQDRNGNTQYDKYVIANRIELLTPKKQDTTSQPQTRDVTGEREEIEDSDLPF